MFHLLSSLAQSCDQECCKQMKTMPKPTTTQTPKLTIIILQPNYISRDGHWPKQPKAACSQPVQLDRFSRPVISTKPTEIQDCQLYPGCYFYALKMTDCVFSVLDKPFKAMIYKREKVRMLLCHHY